jgi:hypothetical protein
MQGAALLNQAGNFGALRLGIRPSIEQVALSCWITETLLVVLPVNIDERADLASKATDGYEFVVDASNRSPFGVYLAHCDLVTTLRRDLQVDTEAVRTGAYSS